MPAKLTVISDLFKPYKSINPLRACHPILEKMIERGFYSPVKSLNDV